MLPNAFFTAIVVPLVFAIRTQSDGQILANEMTLNWPTLAFHFEIKRSSMAIHGYANFSVLAFPVLSRTYKGIDSIMYDTVATFTEGSTLSRYMVVEGKAYASHVSLRDNGLNAGVECDDTGVTPPINAIINAINQAEPVSSNSSNSSGTIKCSSETTLKISIDGVELGLCFAESSGFTLYGSDMTITVKYLKKHERRYKQITKANGTCETVASPASVTTIGRSLLTGKRTLRDSRKLRAFLANFNFSARHHKCSCKSTIRPCVFIHGLRYEGVHGDGLIPVSPRYWGNLTDHSPCCSSKTFVIQSTMGTAWTDDALQQEVCDRILAVNGGSKTREIADTIIIAHSLGNLLLAGAIAKGKCSIASSSTWVGISGPMRGSMASNYFQDSCRNSTNYLSDKIAARTGFCPTTKGITSLAYEGTDYSSAKLDAAYLAAQHIYRRNVDAVMCSNGFSGLPSRRRLWFWTLGILTPHHSLANDGLVEFHSCAGGIPASKFGNSYEDRFYVTKLNHDDTTFRNGDALFNKAKMPLKWFECLL